VAWRGRRRAPALRRVQALCSRRAQRVWQMRVEPRACVPGLTSAVRGLTCREIDYRGDSTRGDDYRERKHERRDRSRKSQSRKLLAAHQVWTESQRADVHARCNREPP